MLTSLKVYKEKHWWEAKLGVRAQIESYCTELVIRQVDVSMLDWLDDDIRMAIIGRVWWHSGAHILVQMRAQEEEA